MNKILSLLFTILFVFNASAQEQTWLVNLEEAQEVSASNEQFILLNFSGSDWCGNCMRLDKDLFQAEDFQAFAEDNLVLLNLDFPAKKANKLNADQAAYNDKLAEKYNKKGVFPLTLVLNPKGEVIGEMTYPSKDVAGYIASIQSIVK